MSTPHQCMTDPERLDALRQHKKTLLQFIEKAVKESQWNCHRYHSEEEYERLLELKTLKYIIEDL